MIKPYPSEGERIADTDFARQGTSCFTEGLLKGSGSRGGPDPASLTWGIITRLNKMRAFDLSLRQSRECYQLVGGGGFSRYSKQKE